ncbi:hypothetical protein, partial [Lacticaseibacillus camelliae]|uniref:hypothetical protein n=1 Tax=Lacticaseibacillus camelliae TaxID=381742 RepID=UPI001CDA78D9
THNLRNDGETKNPTNSVLPANYGHVSIQSPSKYPGTVQRNMWAKTWAKTDFICQALLRISLYRCPAESSHELSIKFASN